MDMASIALQAALVLGVFVILYLALVRPQQRRLQSHRTMIQSLRTGDRVSTSGGLIGTIVRVDDTETVTIEVAESTHVLVVRKKIDEVLAKAD